MSGLITDDLPKKIAVMHDDTPKIKPEATAVASFGFTSANVNVTVSVMNAADNGKKGVIARSSVIAAKISAPSVAYNTTVFVFVFIVCSFTGLLRPKIARD